MTNPSDLREMIAQAIYETDIRRGHEDRRDWESYKINVPSATQAIYRIIDATFAVIGDYMNEYGVAALEENMLKEATDDR